MSLAYADPSFLLGDGYSGYASLNGVYLPLLASDPTEEENLILSNAAFSTSTSFGVGQMAASGRRCLKFTLNTHVSPKSVSLIKEFTYGPWRDNASIDNILPIPFTLVPAGQEGYDGRGYIDSVQISAAENSLIQVSFVITSWVWIDLNDTTALLKERTLFHPSDDSYKPVPSHMSLVEHTAISINSIPLSWSLTLKNNWKYEQLCESFYSTAPNPRHIYPGPLDVTLTMAWLGRKSDRPRETGSVNIQILDQLRTTVGTKVSLLPIRIPLMYRQPSRVPQGTGEPNQPIRWSASYSALGARPY